MIFRNHRKIYMCVSTCRESERVYIYIYICNIQIHYVCNYIYTFIGFGDNFGGEGDGNQIPPIH